MPTFAPRVAPVFGAATAGEQTFLKRPRGVVAVAPPSCVETAQDKFARRVVARMPSAPPAQKRFRDGFDVRISERAGVGKVPVFLPAPALRHLKQRMETEHAVRAAMDGARILAVKRRPEALSAEEAAAKRRKSSSSSNPAPRAAHQRTEPAAKQQQQQQRAAPTTAQRPISKLIEKGKEALKRRRLEEIARAREKFRRELLEVEKAAMPDETIYPEELEELGLTELQYAVTRTRRQAQRCLG